MKQKINCRPVDILERKLEDLPFSLCCIFSLSLQAEAELFVFCSISHRVFCQFLSNLVGELVVN